MADPYTDLFGLPDSVMEHKLWPVLEPFLRVQRYDRDGGHRHPRHRIEVMNPDDPEQRVELLGIEVACAACRAPMKSVRARRGRGKPTLFLSVSCELEHNVACARQAVSHVEYERIVEELLRKGQTMLPRRSRRPKTPKEEE